MYLDILNRIEQEKMYSTWDHWLNFAIDSNSMKNVFPALEGGGGDGVVG